VIRIRGGVKFLCKLLYLQHVNQHNVLAMFSIVSAFGLPTNANISFSFYYFYMRFKESKGDEEQGSCTDLEIFPI